MPGSATRVQRHSEWQTASPRVKRRIVACPAAWHRPSSAVPLHSLPPDSPPHRMPAPATPRWRVYDIKMPLGMMLNESKICSLIHEPNGGLRFAKYAAPCRMPSVQPYRWSCRFQQRQRHGRDLLPACRRRPRRRSAAAADAAQREMPATQSRSARQSAIGC